MQFSFLQRNVVHVVDRHSQFRYRYQRRLLPPGYQRAVKAMRYVVLPQVYTHT